MEGDNVMQKYIIKGGERLEGEVNISGSKNAALPIIAATILNTSKSTLYNVPNIHDTQIMLKILELLGAKVEKKKNKIIIDTNKINKYEIPKDLMGQMRSSVILAGSLIGRYHKATFSYPGGCDIGSRPIDLHLKGFEKLGITIQKEYGNINCNSEIIVGERIDLDFPSVGATENIILASVLAKGETIINNAAREPEIIDLQNFLNKMGAKIKGAGTNQIVIEGVRELKEVSYKIMPDRIEAGTFLCAAAITGGNIKLNDVNPEHITPAIAKLEEANCKINIEKKSLGIKAPKKIKALEIKTMPYPGFPTDLQSLFVSTLTVAKGTSLMVENIFENRYKFTTELIKMGAKITIEGRSAIIKGVRKLYGTSVKATDLRGGAALVLAGLQASGVTTIENIEYILRGYEDFEKKLQKLGARILMK